MDSNRRHPDGSRLYRAAPLAVPAADAVLTVDADSGPPGYPDGFLGAALAAGETAAGGKATDCHVGQPQWPLLPFHGHGQDPRGAGGDTEEAKIAPPGAKIHDRSDGIREAGDNFFRAGVPAEIAVAAEPHLFWITAGRANNLPLLSVTARFRGRQEYFPQGE